eukprot:g4943.t1
MGSKGQIYTADGKVSIIPHATVVSATMIDEATTKLSEVKVSGFDDVAEKNVRTILNERRLREKDFGWQASYGKLTSMKKGNEKRAGAEAKADEWFFAQLGRASKIGQKFASMRSYFNIAKRDFGWKESYGKLTSMERGNKKRHEAEAKALKYTADCFGEDQEDIKPWLVKQYTEAP